VILRHFNGSNRDEALNAEILQAIESDGACVLDGLIPEGLCDALMADFRPHIAAAPWSNQEATNFGETDEFFGRRTKRFHRLPSLSALVSEIATHPRLLALAAEFLGKGAACRDLRISTMELMVLGGGQDPQMLHRDADSWYWLPRPMRSKLLFSANVALCDFRPTNGATVVAPGSHRWPDDRSASPGETCCAVMKKGSALLYRGDVLHGGGDNTEADIRTGLYVGYIPSWLAPLENHALGNERAVLDALDARMQRLLNVSSPFLTFP
jgi:hypothetical protein